jgi:hypothetical protein
MYYTYTAFDAVNLDDVKRVLVGLANEVSGFQVQGLL